MSDPLLLDLGLLPPGRMTLPRLLGGAVESGAALSGVSVASDVSGGGLVAVDYLEIQLSNVNPSRLRYFNRLAQALRGGVRQCVIPLLTDFYAPAPIGAAVSLVPFSDGSTFSDGSDFSQAPVIGAIAADASAGAATVQLSVIGGTGVLEGGEWFGVLHPTKGPRAYCVTDIDAVTSDGANNNIYTVGILPTLRDSVSIGLTVDWWRPRCLMRLASGFSPDIDVANFWQSTPSLKFVEAF